MISGKQHYLVALFIRQKVTFLGSFMTFLRGVISSVAAMLLFAAVSSLFLSSKIRGEKNISSEGVIRNRPPKALTGMFIAFSEKKKYFRYEEFGSFKDTINLGLKGELKGFDKNNKKIFAIEGLHIGASVVADRLRAHGVKEKH